MKLTTKGRYAVTALLDVAMSSQTAPVTIQDIAKRNQLSAAYLERLAGKLRQKGLLMSIRGAQGGYRLGKDMDLISIADIIQAVDEGIDTTRCQGLANCLDGRECATHHLWESLNGVIFDFLKKVTIKDLVNKRSHKALPTKIALSEGMGSIINTDEDPEGITS